MDGQTDNVVDLFPGVSADALPDASDELLSAAHLEVQSDVSVVDMFIGRKTQRTAHDRASESSSLAPKFG